MAIKDEKIIEDLMYKISNGIYKEFKIKNKEQYFLKISKIIGEKKFFQLFQKN